MQIREFWPMYALGALAFIVMIYGMYVGGFDNSIFGVTVLALVAIIIRQKRTILDLREQLSTDD
ncbi:hypothetical protein NDI85_21195 [Halomicroarcula sp. S1AR25-4]|uniref:hypothetical protein n=1 Tax=Haloarcula sp. S1AR25-4 TaxID=2950538 RepID=UPI0028743A21|nr:hypothetical protein [Halomicroarcula sp. S1AR25-4]MDS0280304.1 hypothetical protein [Halomicroarcula sp. S1AR25-4]